MLIKFLVFLNPLARFLASCTFELMPSRMPLETRTHKRLSTDATTTILETTGYDHAGRLTSNKHKLNAAATDTYLSSLSYNYKDQLIEKNLGIGATGILQSLDYAYNPQGWLTSINQPTLGGTNTALFACSTNPTDPNPGAAGAATFNPDPNDLFYLELKYDGQFTGMTGDTLQKNGNINQMMWRTRGRERQAYNFSYDYLDRLRSAVYADVNDAGTVTNNTRYNESLTYADNRGNISNLKRVGGQLSGSCWNFAQIDNLTYSYTAGTNKISSITDAASATYKAKGFNPGGGSGSYVYDVNGNMITDPYKAMTVQYNHLNLPKFFTFTVGAQSNTIEILYDAAGTKLRKTVKTGSTTNYTQDYLGGIEYRDGAREAIYTAEGRVKYTSPTVTRYEYTIKDHLGNARLSFCDLDNSSVINVTNNPATNEVLQENHYYPFGLNTDGPWMNDATLDNKYQYNGKEINDDFGLNWYNYGKRWYDAAIGRFPTVDPIADQFAHVSTYNYAENRPVSGIDLHGLQYVNFNESFYSISVGQTWLHTKSNVSGHDAYGRNYVGTSVPIQQIRFSGSAEKFPLYRGSFARNLQWQGDNLGKMYDASPKNNGNSLDRRFGSAKTYESAVNKSATLGKAGLVLITLDLMKSAYVGIKGYDDAKIRQEQMGAMTKSWNDVFFALNTGSIDPAFHNVSDLSNIANFVYQGSDNFGDNEVLRNTAIDISKRISQNYKGDNSVLKPDSGLDNFKPNPILVAPPLNNQEN